MTEYAIEVIQRSAGDRESGYVFLSPQTGDRYRWITSQLNRVIRELGLTTEDGRELRFHDFRHLFATWLHSQGVSLDDLRWLMGHKDRATTDRYTTVRTRDLSNKLKLIARIKK